MLQFSESYKEKIIIFYYNELHRCKPKRYQIPKKKIPNSKKIKYDACIGELNPKRLNQTITGIALKGQNILTQGEAL